MVTKIALAVGASALAFAARWALTPYLGARQPYTWMFAAVAVAAWYGGWSSGALTSAICVACADFLFVDSSLPTLELVGTASAMITSAIIVFLASRARQSISALKEADRRKNQFITVLAHELRSPPTWSDVQWIAASLQRQTLHMERLISELLDVERIVQNKLHLEKVDVDLRDCLRDAVEACRAVSTSSTCKACLRDWHSAAAESLPAQRSVFYDLDRYDVKAEFRPAIEAHARYLRQHAGARVTVQGNGDERGSREYNLALGQRRAEGVRQLMRVSGAPEHQIEAVSFGEEKPKGVGHDEASWAQNRRSDLVYDRAD